ncbi:MAG: hypothetical protein WC858_02225 [Parcubacteria group bacterium]
MLKKLFLIIVALAILIAFLGGIFSISLSPLSLNIREPEKSYLKSATRKAKNLIYHEATVHNPSGDVLPDQIDDKILNDIKNTVN